MLHALFFTQGENSKWELAKNYFGIIKKNEENKICLLKTKKKPYNLNQLNL